MKRNDRIKIYRQIAEHINSDIDGDHLLCVMLAQLMEGHDIDGSMAYLSVDDKDVEKTFKEAFMFINSCGAHPSGHTNQTRILSMLFAEQIALNP
jgi:hypothetical protein